MGARGGDWLLSPQRNSHFPLCYLSFTFRKPFGLGKITNSHDHRSPKFSRGHVQNTHTHFSPEHFVHPAAASHWLSSLSSIGFQGLQHWRSGRAIKDWSSFVLTRLHGHAHEPLCPVLHHSPPPRIPPVPALGCSQTPLWPGALLLGARQSRC